VIKAVWISISDEVLFFRNPVRTGSDSELQNLVGSRSGHRIIFNTAVLRCELCLFQPLSW